MGPAKGAYDVLHFLISTVSIRYQIPMEVLQQFFRSIPAPGLGIVKNSAWISSHAALRMTQMKDSLLAFFPASLLHWILVSSIWSTPHSASISRIRQ